MTSGDRSSAFCSRDGPAEAPVVRIRRATLVAVAPTTHPFPALFFTREFHGRHPANFLPSYSKRSEMARFIRRFIRRLSCPDGRERVFPRNFPHQADPFISIIKIHYLQVGWSPGLVFLGSGQGTRSLRGLSLIAAPAEWTTFAEGAPPPFSNKGEMIRIYWNQLPRVKFPWRGQFLSR